MSNVYLQDTTLTSIADAIRSKNGSTTTYKPSEMPAAIQAIEGSGGSSTSDGANWSVRAGSCYSSNSSISTGALPGSFSPTAGTQNFSAPIVSGAHPGDIIFGAIDMASNSTSPGFGIISIFCNNGTTTRTPLSTTTFSTSAIAATNRSGRTSNQRTVAGYLKYYPAQPNKFTAPDRLFAPTVTAGLSSDIYQSYSIAILSGVSKIAQADATMHTTPEVMGTALTDDQKTQLSTIYGESFLSTSGTYDEDIDEELALTAFYFLTIPANSIVVATQVSTLAGNYGGVNANTTASVKAYGVRWEIEDGGVALSGIPSVGSRGAVFFNPTSTDKIAVSMKIANSTSNFAGWPVVYTAYEVTPSST